MGQVVKIKINSPRQFLKMRLAVERKVTPALKEDMSNLLETLAEQLRVYVIRTIREGKAFKPLAKSTIRARKARKKRLGLVVGFEDIPLLETGKLISAIKARKKSKFVSELFIDGRIKSSHGKLPMDVLACLLEEGLTFVGKSGKIIKIPSRPFLRIGKERFEKEANEPFKSIKTEFYPKFFKRLNRELKKAGA